MPSKARTPASGLGFRGVLVLIPELHPLGGVKIDNIAEIRRAGADTFVAGSAIFGKPDYPGIIKSMREQIAIGETTAV